MMLGRVLLGMLLAGSGGSVLAESEGERVRLQLKWFHQFQFAGYYAAQQQGYYAEEGLNVEIIEGGAGRSAIPRVLAEEVDFGVADSDLLQARLEGKPVVVCAAIFQHSPYIILSRADRGIRTPGDLVGKSVMVAENQALGQFSAMLMQEGIDPARVNFVPHTRRLEELIDGRVDAISAYASVEPVRLRALGVEPAVMRALDYGVDFYGDTLFTTERQVERHPQRTAAFVRASLRGWAYAMSNREEIADYILTLPGVRQRGLTKVLLEEEAAFMDPLIRPELVEIGHMNRGRWQRIADTLAAQKLVGDNPSLDGFIYTQNVLLNPDVLRWAAGVGAGLLGVGLVVMVWIIQMRRSVRARTRELREEAALRAKAEMEQRALVESLEIERARLAKAQAVAKLGSWETDMRTLAVRWSEETYRIFGCEPRGFSPSHQAFLELVHPEDRAAVDAAFSASVNSIEPQVIEHRLLLADGTIKHVEQRWQQQFDHEGRANRAVGTCQDITERKRGESAHQEVLLRLSDTVESIADAFCTLDTEWCFTYLNRETERMLRKPRAELLGRNVWDALPEMRGTVIEYQLQTAMTERMPVHFEEYYQPLGQWLEIRCYPSAQGLALYFRDVTERRRSEAQLRLLESSIARINDIVIITKAEPLSEPGPEIVFVNDAFERVTGYSREEAIGRSPRFMQGPKTSRDVLERIRFAITRGRPVKEEIINYGKDGREYWLEINITPVADADGRITHLVAVQRDITERKKLEEQFLRAQRMESIGTLAGGIAHDLNNLLSPIIMGADLLFRSETKAETRMVLQNMQRSARRGAELVKQVLSFARGVEGARVSVQLRHIVQEVELIIANTFPKNITFTSNLPPDLRTVTGDPTQLHQVMLNLCVNARDAMPAGGHLSVSGLNVVIDAQYAVMNRGVAAGGYVMIEVSDTGAGMSKEVQDRIFEPFFTTKEVGSGTGLGLSTVLGIVRSHGGFLNVYSEPGRGSVFKIYLPVRAQEPDAGAPLINHDSMPRGAGELILIVDDEATIRSVTRQTLESFGYRAITADDGAQAIALYAQRRKEIALILTDMMMPVMDGASLISAVRRIDATVPIIAASGLNSNSSMAKASAAGVRCFLSKPYGTDTLLQTLKTALGKTSG
jgi:PAS domain S-box-containing protein